MVRVLSDLISSSDRKRSNVLIASSNVSINAPVMFACKGQSALIVIPLPREVLFSNSIKHLKGSTNGSQFLVNPNLK